MIRVPVYSVPQSKPTQPVVVPIFAGAIAGDTVPSEFVLWVPRVGPLPLVENTLS